MAREVGSSNPVPDKPSSSYTEISEDESWLDSCLDLDHLNDAPNNLMISPSSNSNLWIPLSTELFPNENEEDEDEDEISPIKSELPPKNATGEFRTLDLEDDENPSSSLDPGEEDDLATIFLVWDLNTENPELEKGTLTDILTSSLAESPSADGHFYGTNVLSDLPSDLSLRELEKGMKEPQSVESLIAALSGLNLSVNRR